MVVILRFGRLAGQGIEFNLGDVEPAPMLWRVMDLQSTQQAPRLFGRECLVVRSRNMRIEVVTDQRHLLCSRIVQFEKVFPHSTGLFS